jgi:hypothetical protein
MTAVVPVASAQTNTQVIFDSIQQPLPPNVVSLGYEATSTDEFGDHIAFAGVERTLSSVTVAMSAWGKQSEYPSMTDPSGWSHPITLNLYAVDNSGANPAPGALIATTTQSFQIPWRPEADPTCPTPTAWRAGDGNCYNGYAFTIVFDMTGVVVPNEIIYGIAYNTQHYGATPLNVAGPYNSLNVGLSETAPSTGTDVNTDAAIWDTGYGPFYADGGAGGVDTFRFDTNWSPYTPTVQFAVAVEPTSGELLQDLRGDTADLVSNPGVERSLLATLDRVQRYLDNGNTFFAYMTMLQYVMQVDRFENVRQISPSAATQLLTQAQAVVQSIF